MYGGQGNYAPQFRQPLPPPPTPPQPPPSYQQAFIFCFFVFLFFFCFFLFLFFFCFCFCLVFFLFLFSFYRLAYSGPAPPFLRAPPGPILQTTYFNRVVASLAQPAQFPHPPPVSSTQPYMLLPSPPPLSPPPPPPPLQTHANGTTFVPTSLPNSQPQGQVFYHTLHPPLPGIINASTQPPWPTNAPNPPHPHPNFENIARSKEAGNPHFTLLFGGEPGSAAAIGHEYFQWMKKKYLAVMESPKGLKPKVVPISTLTADDSSQSKNLECVDGVLSPATSDMEMEDDITLADIGKGISNTNEESAVSTHEGSYASENVEEHIHAKIPVASGASSPTLSLMDAEDEKESSVFEDVSPERGSPVLLA